MARSPDNSGAPGLVLVMLGTYTKVWRLFIANARERWDEIADVTSQLDALFKPLDVAVNMLLNLVFWNVTHLSLISIVGFSASLLNFSMCFIVLPSLCGGCAFIHYKYGLRMWKLSPAMVLAWLHNWMLVNMIACVCWTQQGVVYAVLLGLEPWLPAMLQGSITFPLHTMERLFINTTIAFHVLSLALILLLPVWRYSFQLNMSLVGRRSQMSSFECFMEIMYMGSSSMAVVGLVGPIFLLQANFGFPFHKVHLFFGAFEILFINQIAKYKFQLLHKLSHDIKPLYHMVHLEHHICKGIYPNSSAAGMWEFWMLGGSFGFVGHCLHCLPYVSFTMIYGGANILVHTMWPWKSWAQWHTLHHIVLADVFSVNAPSNHDKAFSKDVAKYADKLCAVSPFVRYEWLTDVASFGFMLVSAVLLHYGLGWSIVAVWHEML